MLAINWEKIDKFYITLVIVLMIMAALVIFTFRGVFSSFLTAFELSTEELGSKDLKVDTVKLDEAYDSVYKKPVIPLKIKE
jgi:hypothetical protein